MEEADAGPQVIERGEAGNGEAGRGEAGIGNREAKRERLVLVCW